ncbi:MAG TPA: hypothetical protein VM434_13040 [Beijerinckiaceae bacterium]|nr:hypothetical protein [Beijerinckiaceae bacterium]
MTRITGALAAAAIVFGVTACQDGRGLLAGRTSPSGVPVAVESIEGAPPAVRTALADELASAANARQVELVGMSAEARYRVRGYLSTEPREDGGAALAFVWDVFDAEKRRAQRLTGSRPIPAGEDPWDGLDKQALARLAAESMDGIADFLSRTKVAGLAPDAPSAAPVAPGGPAAAFAFTR